MGLLTHLLAIVGHMFTKSVHQPLGNFKSKNPMGKLLLLGIFCRLSSASRAEIGPTFHRWCQDKPSRIWNRNKKILDHLAQGAPTTNRSLMWWASQGTFVICPLVLNLFPLCHWLSHRELCAKKNTWTLRRPQRKNSRPSRAVLHLDLEQPMFCETV